MELFKDLVEVIFTCLRDLGYWGIMFGLMIEVIPSEIVLAYGGYLVSIGEVSFLEAVVFGTIGGTIAQIFVYWVGRYGGRPFIKKYGKYILIHQRHLDISERWFERYGSGMIFTARFIPVVRHAISIPAGIVRMPLLRFTVLTTLAVIPWSIFFVYLGFSLGANWREIHERSEPYILPFIIVSVLLTVLYVAWKMIKNPKRQREKAGRLGEKLTAHQLKFLGSEYEVIHARTLHTGSSSQEFDHIVIGPNGVFHIETKYWSGVIRITPEGVERSKETRNEDPTNQMYRHEYVLKEVLRPLKMKPQVVGIVCFAHPDCRIEGRSSVFMTVKLDQLLHRIKTYTSSADQLGREDIKQIKQHILKHSEPSKF